MNNGKVLKEILPCMVFISTVLVAHSQITLDSTVLKIDTVHSGLNVPWEIKWGPDNWIWTTERYGRVSRINPGNGAQDIVLDHSSQVYQSSESGMLGMEIHPDFANYPYVYVVYTFGATGGIYERLSRFEYNGTDLINEAVLLDSIPGSFNHDGSRLLILSDNTLLMSTGDALNQAAAQDHNSLNGKILRLNPDGSIPADNPYPNSYIYTSGHRNPQGLLLHPSGKIYSSEHGPTTNDELQIILYGRNYGWPNVEGFCDLPAEQAFCADSNVVEPLSVWTPTIAPSDLAYYDHPDIPEWKDAVLMAVLKEKMIVAIRLNQAGDQIMSQSQYINNEFGRIRDVLIGPDGTVYIATNGPNPVNSAPFSHAIIALRPKNPVGLREMEMKEAEWKIYPNPVHSHLYCSGQFKGAVHYEIINGQAKVCKSGMLEYAKEGFSFMVEDLAAGIYFLSLRSNGLVRSRKFIKD